MSQGLYMVYRGLSHLCLVKYYKEESINPSDICMGPDWEIFYSFHFQFISNLEA